MLAVAVLVAAGPVAAERAIYRCHTLEGALLFQDKPCNTVATTREAASDREGEIVATATAASGSGTPAAENYARYLEFLSKDRREQQAADEAETARLRARAEADRAAAESAAPARSACTRADGTGACGIASYTELPYAYVLPVPVYPYHHGPIRAPATPVPDRQTPRPLGPNQPPRPPLRDARSEILSLAP